MYLSETNMEKNKGVIGYARLTLLVLKRNPSLTYEEASELIGKAKTLIMVH